MDEEDFVALIDATWPPQKTALFGPITCRFGGGGGQRVSSATALRPANDNELRQSIDWMIDANQSPLFRTQPGSPFDAQLDALGFTAWDRTNFLVAPARELALLELPPIHAFEVWPPLAIQSDIWTSGGVDAARQVVMTRVKAPKTALLGRVGDSPVGAAFAAIREKFAMVHAVTVKPSARRQKAAHHMMVLAARWALGLGAENLAVLCVADNNSANAFFSSLGFEPVGQYHYMGPNNEKS